jgi:hypothetical protein
VSTSKERDLTDATPRPAGGGSPSVQGGWDFADRLIGRIASGSWTWSKTWQVALLFMVFAGSLVTVAWAAHGWTGWAAGIVAGASGTSAGVAAYRRLPSRM